MTTVTVLKPKAIVTRIYGVTTSSAFGDECFRYFMNHVEPYVAEHFADETMMSLLRNLRKQVVDSASGSQLPTIAPDSDGAAAVAKSVHNFVEKRAHLVRTQKKAARLLPALGELKSLVIGQGLTSGVLRAHVYDDVLPAFTSWKSKHIKIFTLSTAPVDGQLAFFAHTTSGDLHKLLDDGISTVHPILNNTASAINYRKLAKIVDEELENILLITDKPKEAREADRLTIQVVLVVREGKLGHSQMTSSLEEKTSEFKKVTSLLDIAFATDTKGPQG